MLVVLEGRDRYVLRGATRAEIGDGNYEGGDFVADEAMRQSPFFAHAKEVWAKVRDQKPW